MGSPQQSTHLGCDIPAGVPGPARLETDCGSLAQHGPDLGTTLQCRTQAKHGLSRAGLCRSLAGTSQFIPLLTYFSIKELSYLRIYICQWKKINIASHHGKGWPKWTCGLWFFHHMHVKFCNQKSNRKNNKHYDSCNLT